MLHHLFVLQEVIETSNKKMICFIKLHATWPILCHHAEELNMRAPLQVCVMPTDEVCMLVTMMIKVVRDVTWHSPGHES